MVAIDERDEVFGVGRIESMADKTTSDFRSKSESPECLIDHVGDFNFLPPIDLPSQ